MKLGDVIYLNQDRGVYSETKKPTPATVSLVTSLLNDPRFIKDVTTLRTDHSIKVPYSFEILNDPVNGHMDLYELMSDVLKGLVVQYNLPRDYQFCLYVFTICNAFINIWEDEKQDMIYLPNAGEISNYIELIEELEDRTSAVMIGAQCTKEDFVNWLDKNWSEIERQMKTSLPESPRIGNSYQNIQIAQQILELRSEGKTFERISDILSKLYPENDSVNDPAWIKTTLYRHLRRCRKFIEKYPDTED